MGVGGVLLVHSEIYYVPVDDATWEQPRLDCTRVHTPLSPLYGWEVVLVRNVLHYVPVLNYVTKTHPPSPPLLQNIQQGRIFIL